MLVATAAAFGGAGFGFAGFDFGEVDDGLGDVVGIVSQDVEGDVLDDLDDFGIVQAGDAGGLQVGVNDDAALQGDGAGKLDRCVGFAIGGGGISSSEDFIGGESGISTEQGVGAEAVAAAIDLGDGECDLLAELLVAVRWSYGCNNRALAIDLDRAIS